MTHDELCIRALRWLRGTKRCHPAYWRNASCGEIPDAIGWTSSGGSSSIVVECKTSVSDFIADKKKWIGWIRKGEADCWPARRSWWSDKAAEEMGYERVELPSMGDYRHFMCEGPHVITEEAIKSRAPDHGLLYVEGRRVRVVVPAPQRTNVDYRSEIRYLRFAIINAKKPYCPEPEAQLKLEAFQ